MKKGNERCKVNCTHFIEFIKNVFDLFYVVVSLSRMLDAHCCRSSKKK